MLYYDCVLQTKVLFTTLVTFKLKLRSNTWAAGALPLTPLGSLQHSPRPLVPLTGPTSKQEGSDEEREVEVVPPLFGRKLRSCVLIWMY